MSKQVKKSKTINFNSWIALLEAIIFLLSKDVIPLNPAIQGSILIGVNAIINIILRFKTKEPLEVKKRQRANK